MAGSMEGKHSDSGEGTSSPKETTSGRDFMRYDDTNQQTDNIGTILATDVKSSKNTQEDLNQQIRKHLEEAKKSISEAENKPSQTQAIDFLRYDVSTSPKNRFKLVKQKVEDVTKTVEDLLQKMDTPHMTEQVKDNLLKTISSLSEKLSIFSQQAVDKSKWRRNYDERIIDNLKK